MSRSTRVSFGSTPKHRDEQRIDKHVIRASVREELGKVDISDPDEANLNILIRGRESYDLVDQRSLTEYMSPNSRKWHGKTPEEIEEIIVEGRRK